MSVYKAYVMAMAISLMGLGCSSSRRIGYITKHNEVVTLESWDSVCNYSHGFVVVQVDGEQTFANKNGTLLSQRFDMVGSFSEGLARAKVNDKYGYVGLAGEWVIGPQYAMAYEFSEGRASVSFDAKFVFDYMDLKRLSYTMVQVGQFGFIDAQGNVVIPPRYSNVCSFSDGLAYVIPEEGDDNPTGEQRPFYIDPMGEVALDASYGGCSSFSEGLAVYDSWVRNDPCSSYGRYGYMDTHGETVIEPSFDYAEPFSDGLAVVALNGKYCYIDCNGQVVLETDYLRVEAFVDGMAPVMVKEGHGKLGQDEWWGFINKRGELMIEPQELLDSRGEYISLSSFSEGLVPWWRGDRWGYMNKNGEWAIEPMYARTYPFSEGLAAVKLD